MIVGEAEVDVHARTGAVEGEIGRDFDRIGQRAGSRFGRHISDSAATELERGGARFARSGRLLSNVFTSNSAAALGPLQEVADKVNLIGATLEQTRSRAGGAMLGIGAAATGVGAFLLTVASREEGAHKRLAAAIQAQGGDIEDYQARIDKAIKAGERFGQSGNQTLDAIQALTIGLHDPKKALDELGLAEDIAAAKQIPLSAAANIVRQAYNGNTRVLKAFGIQVKDVVDGEKLLTDAHAAQRTATSKLATAQQQFTDKLAVYRDTLKPTLAQQIALRESHDKLRQAQADAKQAAANVAEAQRQANDAGSKGQEVLDKLAKITAGQASASADTFIGRLKGIGANIEDVIARQHTLGTVLVGTGPILAGIGAVVEVVMTGKLVKAQRAANALRDAEVGGAEKGAAAQVLGATTGETAIVTASGSEVVAVGTVIAAEEGIGVAADAAAVQVTGAAAVMRTALATVATGAGRIAAILGGLGLGVVGGAIVGIGVGFAVKEAVDTNRLVGTLDAQVKALHATVTGTKGKDQLAAIQAEITRAKQLGVVLDDKGRILEIDPTAKNANQRSAGERLLKDALAAQKKIADAKQIAEQKGLVDDANAERKAQQHGHSIAENMKKGAATVKPQSTEDFLKSLGLGPLANSALDKALSDEQKKAGERARQIGNEVTRGMRDQIAVVRREVSVLSSERTKILDFRSSVLSAAGSFTQLGGLLDDSSTATAGRIERSLSDRLLGLKTFADNLQALGRRGLDKGVIAELAQGGPEQRALSSALVRGSAEQIAALNTTERAVRQQQQRVAAVATDARFGPHALDKANGELARLNAQIAVLNKQVQAQPALIATAVDQARKNAAVTTRTGSRTAVTR